VCLIGEMFEHNLAEPGVGEDLWPLGEWQVGADDDGGFSCPLADDPEEHFGGDLRQQHSSKFIDHDQLQARSTGQHPGRAVVSLHVDDLVAQRGGSGKAHSFSLTAGRDRQVDG
jgi:hypothetical protein